MSRPAASCLPAFDARVVLSCGPAWRAGRARPSVAPLLLATPFFVLAVAASLVQATMAAAKQPLDAQPPRQRLTLRMLIAWLHLIQPLARLIGRMRYGVAPWRWALAQMPALLGRRHAIWSEEWQPIETRLAEIESSAVAQA